MCLHCIGSRYFAGFQVFFSGLHLPSFGNKSTEYFFISFEYELLSGEQFSAPQQLQETQCSFWYLFLEWILINPGWSNFSTFLQLHEEILFMWTSFSWHRQQEILQFTFLSLERQLSKALVDGIHCELPLGYFYRHTCMQINRIYVYHWNWFEYHVLLQLYFWQTLIFAAWHLQCTMIVKAIILVLLSLLSLTSPIVHFKNTGACIKLCLYLTIAQNSLEWKT